eukprot:TRINITY_DN54042_c0_g1_i1.p3 TRINITY_DN54042_c0_g1~~TRINITY_DN54042_c0_g1_i1.p3  ORF type:complete len:124 (-),score=19.41 TRINITY_DN54042_c0_g1_i1:133-504(-)
MITKVCEWYYLIYVVFFFSSRRRHTRCREVSWARRCVQETANIQIGVSNKVSAASHEYSLQSCPSNTQIGTFKCFEREEYSHCLSIFSKQFILVFIKSVIGVGSFFTFFCIVIPLLELSLIHI